MKNPPEKWPKMLYFGKNESTLGKMISGILGALPLPVTDLRAEVPTFRAHWGTPPTPRRIPEAPPCRAGCGGTRCASRGGAAPRPPALGGANPVLRTGFFKTGGREGPNHPIPPGGV